MDRPGGARAPATSPPPEPAHGVWPRPESPHGRRLRVGAPPSGRAPPRAGGVVRLLRRVTGPRVRPGHALRRVLRLGDRPILGPGRAARHHPALRSRGQPTRRRDHAGRLGRHDHGELHESPRGVDRCRLQRRLHGAPRADDLPDRRRRVRRAGAGALGAGARHQRDGGAPDRVYASRDARSRQPTAHGLAMRSGVRCASRACVLGLLLAGARVAAGPPDAAGPLPPATEQRYAGAIEALRRGDPEPALGAFAAADRLLPVADYLGYLRVEALLRRDDLAGARRAAEALAARFPDGRVGRAALLLAAQLAARAGEEPRATALLRRYLLNNAESPDTPEALYLLAASFEIQGAA